MKSSSKPGRILVSAVLLAVLYIPINLLWVQVLPAYSRLLAGVAETTINIFEFSDTTYRISVEESNYEVVARISVKAGYGQQSVYDFSGTRKIDMVSYNISLWAVLFLATVAFISPAARWKFLIIAPIIISLWHICDLAIFAKNTRWILTKQLNEQSPSMIDYNYSWHWFWYWAKELNRRIVDPFLPLLLWIIICSKSFLDQKTSSSSQ